MTEEGMVFKWGHLHHLHVINEVFTRHLYREIPPILSWKSTCWVVSLKYMHTNAYSMVNKHDGLELCVHLQGLVGIMEKQ